MQDQLLGRQIADFRVEALIGRGGMGRVYRARQVSLERSVALKVLSVDAADDELFRARFLRESRLAASIDHPNILPIYAAGEAEGRLYIAMRYVDGYDLRALLQREAPLSVERAVSFLRQAAGALDAAHDRGLVHRDVKPANFLIAQEHLYLADFGIAREASTSRDLTRVDAFVGTLDYASPEQIRHNAIDARSDLYSLACVFFECLSGTPPYDRPTEHGVMQAHLNDNPPSVSALRDGLPLAIDAVLATALAKDPDDRYRTGRHFLQAIQASLSSREAAPAPIPIPARQTVIESSLDHRGSATAVDQRPVPGTAVSHGLSSSVVAPRVIAEPAAAQPMSSRKGQKGRSRRWLAVAVLVIGTAAGFPVVADRYGAPPTLSTQIENDARSHGWGTHRVESGEFTNQIAITEHVDLASLIDANVRYYPDISKTTPPIGSMLLIPRTVAGASPTPSDPTTPPSTQAPVPTHPYAVLLRPEQMIMPQSEFPLAGYTQARDQAVSSRTGRAWLRDFTSNTGQYWSASFIVTVYPPDMQASSAIASTTCSGIWDWSKSTEQPVITEIAAEVIGDGAKACRYAFPTFGDTVSYTTGTRNTTVTSSVTVRTVGIPQAIATAVLLAKQQLGIIERVAPR